MGTLSAFGSPPPVLGSARSGSLGSRGTDSRDASLALSIERGLPVITMATFEMTNCELRVDPKAGVSVSLDVEDIYKKTQPRTWRPFPNTELYYYNIKTVSLCNTNMKPFLRKTLGTETGELGIDPTWFSVGSRTKGHKPTPDPTPKSVALSGVWCNAAHDEYTKFFVRLWHSGTLTFVGAPPPHIDNLEAALDFPMTILRLFVHELIRDEATRDQILDSGISAYSNITGGLQFNGRFPDMARTAVASARWTGVDLSYEPEITSCNKFYITKLHGAAEYLLQASKISMGKTGHVQILGAKCLTDFCNTVASAEGLIHDLVNSGHIVVTGIFENETGENKLSGEDLRTIREIRSTISPTAIRATTQLGSDMQCPLTRGNRPDDIAKIENAMRATADPLPLAPGEWQGDPLQCPGSVNRPTHRRVSISRELFTEHGPVQSIGNDSLCPPGFPPLNEQELLAVGETLTPFDHETSGEFHIPSDTVSLICLRQNGEFTMSERQVTPRAINNHDIRTLLTPRTRELENEPPITAAADDPPITPAAPTVQDVAVEAAEEAAEDAAGQYRTPRADTPRKDGNPFAHFLDEEDSDSSDEDTLIDRGQTPTPEAVLPEAIQTPTTEAVLTEAVLTGAVQTPTTEAVLTEAVLTGAVQTPTTEADDDTPIASLVTKRKKRSTKSNQEVLFREELPETFKRAKCSDEKQFRTRGMLYKDMPWNIWYSSTTRDRNDGGKKTTTNDYRFVIWDSEHRSAEGLTTKPFMGVDNNGNPLKPGQVSTQHLRTAIAVKKYVDSLNEAEDPEDPEVAVGNLDDTETIMTADLNAFEEQVTTAEQELLERQERLEVMKARPLQAAPTAEVPTQIQEPPQVVTAGFVKRVPSFPAIMPRMWPEPDINNVKRAMETHKDVSPILKKRKLIGTTFNAGYTRPVSINHIVNKVLHIEKMAAFEPEQEAEKEQAPEAELVPTPEAELVPTPEVRWSPDAIISLKALMRRFRHSESNRIDAIYDSLNQQMAGIPPGMGVQAPARFTKVDITRKIAQIQRQAQQSAGFRSPPAPSS